MKPSTNRTPRALGALLGLGALLAPGLAHADLAATFASAITVDTQYVTGANAATDIAWAGDGRAVITTKTGTVWLRATNGTKTMLANLFTGLTTTSEQGLLGVVADPGVATNNTFYFYADTGPTADKHRIIKGTLSGNTLTVDLANPIVAAGRNLGPGLEGPANHDGGGMFIYQNHLYIGVGDTGHNLTPPNNKYGSCLNKGNGKILRVNLDGTIPTDNPLVNETMVTGCDTFNGAWTMAAPDKRIYAWGFRNPWRLWVDPHTGLLWVGDVGETTREEIDIGAGNNHYGWPFNEGKHAYADIDGKNCNTAFTPGHACRAAVYDYCNTLQGAQQCSQNERRGSAVMGGLIPEGCGWTAAFSNKLYYLFADFAAGFIDMLEVNPDRMGVTAATVTTPVNFGTYTGGPVSFRMGPDQSLYIVFNGAGAVYRFTPNVQTGADCMGTGGMGGAGGMSGMGGAGRGGAGMASGAGGAAMGGLGGVGGASGGLAGDGAIPPGGMSTGGASAGTGTSGAAGTGMATGGTTSGGASSGGTSPQGGAPTGGASSGGTSTTGGTSDRNANNIDDSGGCGCRLTKSGGAGTLALALGLVLAFGARFRRGRRGKH